MQGAVGQEKDGALAILPIHFDLPGHAILLSTFVRTAEQAARIIASLNKELFAGELEYKVLVLPPQEGSFKSKIGIFLVGGWAAVWSFTESEVGRAFTRGLTTQEPAQWAEKIGSAIRKQIVPDVKDDNNLNEVLSDEESKCLASAEFLVEVTKSFLQKDVLELGELGVTTTRFRECFVARNEFYEACIEVRDLNAVGFEEKPVFPIGRRDFFRLQVSVPTVKDEGNEPWLTGIVDLKVTSPNWDREDRQRFWKGRDIKGRERLFRIEDEHFWALVKAERLNINIIDVIKVQWAFQGKVNSPKNIRVLKVLNFNRDVLSVALNQNALDAILGVYSEMESEQADLFKRYAQYE